MPLKFREKKALVKKLNETAKKAVSVVLADNCGITVNKMNLLRKTGRELGISIHIVRNTLLQFIVKGTSFEKKLEKLFIGPTLIAFAYQHPGAAARLLQDFAKNNPTKLNIKAAFFDGKLMLTEKEIDYLAQLPTYEESLEIFIRVLQETAIGRFIRTLIAYRNKKHLDSTINPIEIIK
ncbi:MAG: 50S ribosomal protein L10 [Candidatus Dasytiphilus stammeri]